MTDKKNSLEINEKELMDFYNYSGRLGKFQLKLRLLKSWILHWIAYSSPHPGVTIYMQKARGIRIGCNCHIAPYVQLDWLYPSQISIGDNVAIGSNTMIFAHINIGTNEFLKTKKYPRQVKPVNIKTGAWINPGCIITAGVTIGENSILSVGSIVTNDVPDYCIAAGNPARVIKKIEH
jgi:acetyltransferase-like isoleucine patch superfamily enzyme